MNALKIMIIALFFMSLKANAILECTSAVAKGMAYSAIKSKFPALAQDISTFEVFDLGENWAVYIPAKTTSQRGGGIPEAVVKKETCEVINVHLSR